MVILMLPNIFYSVKNKDGFTNKYQNKTVLFFEQIGRYGSFALMIINIPYLTIGYWLNDGQIIYLIINGILCIFYCLFWLIDWKEKKEIRALLLSIIPSIIFLISGILLLNIPLIVCAIIFAICHIKISYKNVTLK